MQNTDTAPLQNRKRCRETVVAATEQHHCKQCYCDYRLTAQWPLSREKVMQRFCCDSGIFLFPAMPG